MQWPDELLDRAKKMFSEGNSHGTIARELSKQFPGLTRNAVIGKLTRIGVTRSAQAPAEVVKTSVVRSLKPRPAGARTSLPTIVPQITEPAPKPHPQQLVPFGPKSILDLAWNECRYAIGEDDEGTHLFCAQPIRPGCSYCRNHAEICLTGHGLRKAERDLERART